MSELIPGFPYSLLIGPIAVVIYFVYSIFRSLKSGSHSVIKNEKIPYSEIGNVNAGVTCSWREG